MEFIAPKSWRLIESADLKVDIANTIRRLWNQPVDGKHTFIGANPVSLLRSHMEQMKNEKYVVAEKTDGHRFFLMFFTVQKQNPSRTYRVSVFVNRRMVIFLSPVQSSDANLYRGTILDGELVKSHAQETSSSSQINFYFLFFDMLAVSGRCVTQESYARRLQYCQEIVSNSLIPGSDELEYRVKQIFHLAQIPHLVSQVITKQPYENDGLIFTPLQCALTPNRNHHQFKWKSNEQHFMDFVTRIEKHSSSGSSKRVLCQLWQMNQKRLDMFTKTWIHVSHFCALGITDMREFDKHDFILEYAHHMPTNSWRPVRKRTDKEFPNDKYTIEMTLSNIRENIGIHELYGSQFK